MRNNDFIIKNGVLKKYTGTNKDVIVPNGVTKIATEAFYNCDDLKTVILPQGIEVIETNAFSCCYNLFEIKIPASVITIKSNAVYNCAFLNILCQAEHKPDGWEKDWNKYNWNNNYCPVIWNCENNETDENGYKYAYVNGAKYAIKDREAILLKYIERNFVSIEIPSKITVEGEDYCVTKLGRDLFYRYTMLERVKIPDTITEIGESAFAECSSLEKIEIPNSVTKIASATFNCCKALKEVSMGDNVESIGGYAFSGCDYLRSFNLPKKLKIIGERAFYCCYFLDKFIMPKEVKEIGKGAFHLCNKLIIYSELSSRPKGWCEDLERYRIFWNYKDDKNKKLIDELCSLLTEEELIEIVEKAKNKQQ